MSGQGSIEVDEVKRNVEMDEAVATEAANAAKAIKVSRSVGQVKVMSGQGSIEVDEVKRNVEMDEAVATEAANAARAIKVSRSGQGHVRTGEYRGRGGQTQRGEGRGCGYRGS